MQFRPQIFVLCYEGEGEGEGEGNQQGNQPGNAAPQSDDKTFTQDDLNRILAEDKRKHQEKLKQVESNYQELLKSQSLTKEERDKLKSQLDDLQKSQLTKEQQLERERKESEEKYRNELKSQMERANHWEGLFKKETISRSLQDAATSAEAFNPNQIVGLLQPFTELKEVEGNLAPMVDFPDIDEKTGKEIRTLRTPLDAVKRMKELPKMYGNLFKSNVVSGVGAGNAPGTGELDAIDYSNMTPEQYRKHRQAIKDKLSKR
jgi:hypothetical protein